MSRLEIEVFDLRNAKLNKHDMYNMQYAFFLIYEKNGSQPQPYLQITTPQEFCGWVRSK